MQDKFNQFYNLYNGKFVEAEDVPNYAQCMDLVFKWLDFINIPRDTIRYLYAYQVWINPFDSTKQYFDLIANSPTNIPLVGDIPVFGQSVGYAGHISISSDKSDINNLISLDQNWGNPKYTRLVTHTNYYGCLGWLHPKPQTPIKMIPSDQILAITEGAGSDGDKLQKIRLLCKI